MLSYARAMRLPRAMSSRPRTLATTATVTVAVLALAGGPSTTASADDGPDDRCDLLGATSATGSVAASDLDELSGIGASRTLPGVLWAHNDSGDSARLFALDDAGTDLGTYDVADPNGAELDATDWEDIAVVADPADGTGWIYVADIGDNAAARTDGVIVRRVAEPTSAPDGTGGTLTADASIIVHYPGGPTDAEALLVDPVDGTILIVTKDLLGSSLVLTVPASTWVAGTITETEATVAGTVAIGAAELAAAGALDGDLPGTLVTAGDVAADGSWAVLRTYQAIVVVDRPSGTTLADALVGEHCVAALTGRPQGESIAITADGTGIITATEVQRAIDSGDLDQGSTSPIERTEVAPATVAPTAVEPTTTPTSVRPAPETTQTVGAATPSTTAPSTAAPSSTAPESTPTTAAGGSEGSDDRGAAYVVAAIGAVVAIGVIAFAIRQSAKRRPDR